MPPPFDLRCAVLAAVLGAPARPPAAGRPPRPPGALTAAGRCAGAGGAGSAAAAPPEETAPEGAEPPAPAPAAGPAASGRWRRPGCRACSTRARCRASIRARSAATGCASRARHPARVPLADPLRQRPPRARVPQRPQDRAQRRPLHALHVAEAKDCDPRRRNELVVVVDSRKDPRLLEGWWNWDGIVRPVRLIPAGRAHVRDLGTMSQGAVPRAGPHLPGLVARRRAAGAPRRAGDQADARGPAALTRRAGPRKRSGSLASARPASGSARAVRAPDLWSPGAPAALLGPPALWASGRGAAGRAGTGRPALGGGQARPPPST